MLDKRLVGTWAPVSNEWVMPDGSIAFQPFGAEPLGQLIYSADGSVSTVLADPDRPASARPREGPLEDRALAFDRLLAYTGTWEVVGDSVVHHVIAGSIPEDTGRDRIRRFTLSGDELTLIAPPRLVDGVEQTHRISWRRRRAATQS